LKNIGPMGCAKGDWIMPHDGSLLLRFLAKVVFEIVPAALASVVGGILFTHYQMGYSGTPKPVVEQAAPASAEMVRLLRDEHAAIVDYLKAQTEAEKSRLAAEDEASARSVAEAKAALAAAAIAATPAAAPAIAATPAAAPIAAQRRPNAIVPAVKVAANRGRAPAAAPPRAPLVIAQVEQSSGAASAQPSASNSESLLAKTLDIKDRVVDATLHVIDTIGSIPSMIASRGDHAGASNATVPPAGRLVGASS
jgi:hypothetical protein